ncbi:ArnT family glycosyltransferase [Dyella sp. A6]|uniref:ArnT family glycosyltransferase n=1 Tax=Dyella aluminiiresistens TaxID=3069105 RepID=UPI002E775027|nr:glycosyltransferase family 39 protein [Dyella sp. A6]
MKLLSRLQTLIDEQPWMVMLLLLPVLWILPAVPVDETRYLSIAWEMRQTGSWITLHVDGVPYFDKPPLLFWLVNLAWSMFGVSLWSARLVSVLAGTGCVALLAAISRRLDARAGNTAAWMLPGFVYFLLFAGVVMFDITLTCCVLLAYLAVLRWVQGGGWRALLLLFVASSLGMLAKGPVMLLHLAGPILLAPWWAAPSIRVSWKRLGWPLLMALLGGLPVLLWALAAVHGLGEADARDLLVRQTAGRVVHSFAHRRPVWWYLIWLLPILLPWPLVLRWKRLAAWRTTWRSSMMARFGLCASLPAFLGFCLVSGKQLHYLLPCMPGVALLLASLGGRPGELLAPRRLWWLALLCVGLWVWAVLRPGDMQPWPMTEGARYGLLGLSALLLLAAAVVLWHAGQAGGARHITVATALLALGMLPVMRTQVLGASDLRGLAHRVAALQARQVPMAAEASEPGLVNFLGRLPRTLPVTDDPEAWAKAHPQGYLLMWASHGKRPDNGLSTTAVGNGWAAVLPASAVAPAQPEKAAE